MKKVIIVGAGPGGLTAGMILAHRGYDVSIYEKNKEVGGRNGSLESNGFKFDIGPTFLMLKPTLDEMFAETGENINDYLKFYDLDPMYQLVFKNKAINISPDHEKTRNEIAKNFPGDEVGFDRLMKREKKRFDTAYPCLKKDYSKFRQLFNKDLFKFLTKLSFPNSMHDELGKYFKDEDLKMAFTFQSKYLGMSPWDCPAAYMIIPYIEHNFGIQHVRGGLSEISEAMKKVFLKKGGKLLLEQEVSHIEKNSITLKSDQQITADYVINNADAGYAMKDLMKYKDLSKKDFSCSTYMLYLGLDTKLDLEHHTVFFSEDYKAFVDSIFHEKKINLDISFYVRNASVVDDSLAPEGCSNIYILLPTANNKSNINWDIEGPKMRELILDKLEEKINKKIRNHIKTELSINPKEWEEKYNVFLGATFNLGHKLSQMLYFRPHNLLKNGVYLVGGGTNPGSGLPTIYESGRIAANIISEKNK